MNSNIGPILSTRPPGSIIIFFMEVDKWPRAITKMVYMETIHSPPIVVPFCLSDLQAPFGTSVLASCEGCWRPAASCRIPWPALPKHPSNNIIKWLTIILSRIWNVLYNKCNRPNNRQIKNENYYTASCDVHYNSLYASSVALHSHVYP